MKKETEKVMVTVCSEKIDTGLGSGTGININSTEEEIAAVAKNIRAIVESL